MERVTNIDLPGDLLRHFGRKDPLIIKSASPYEVSSFSDLIRLTAEVSCANSAMTVLYRGQRNEHMNGDGTLLLPSLYRWQGASQPTSSEIRSRANRLNIVAEQLVRVADMMITEGASRNDLNYGQLVKRASLQWGVLQHYEYCPTPFLDVTQSLRMACMFALDHARDVDRPCVYVLGFPYINDKYFRDSTNELMVVRLLSAMPPIAKRAYFQEGYLVGSEFDKTRYSTKHDVAHRLLAKFELVGNKEDWIAQLSTYARSDVYSEDLFSSMKEKVLSLSGIDGEGPKAERTLLTPERFPSLAV